MKEGIYVNIHDNESRVIIEPSKANVSYSLDDLLSEITGDNIHQCIETGMPAGNEIW